MTLLDEAGREVKAGRMMDSDLSPFSEDEARLKTHKQERMNSTGKFQL